MKEILKKIFMGECIVSLFLSLILSARAAGYLYDSKDVKYDNSKSGLSARM